MKNKKNKNVTSKFSAVMIISYFFIVIETSLFILLYRFNAVVSALDFICWLSLGFFIYLFVIYVVLRYRLFKLLFTLPVCAGSGLALFFLMGIQLSIFAEVILAFFLGISLIGVLLFFRFSKSKTIKIAFKKPLTTILVILVFLSGLLVFNPFFYLKIELIIIFILSLVSIKNSFKARHRSKKGKLHLGPVIKVILILLPILCGAVLFLPSRTITINPENSPEIVFWSSAALIPSEEETLDLCAANNISFTIVLRESYISDGGAAEYIKIKNALDRGVKIYISIGGYDSECYATLDNTDWFIDIYKTIRTWLIEKDLFDSIDAFVVDAEPPRKLLEDLDDESFWGRLQYMVNNISTIEFEELAEDNLEEFIAAIHGDGKEIGIVKMPSIFDELDGDGDYSRVSKTIYNLDLDWDFSVSMTYRTMHIPTIYNLLLNSLRNYDYTTEYDLTYFDLPAVEQNLLPLSTYYYKMSYEVYSSEVDVPQDRRYAFVGTFWSKFGETSYIENKEYLKDIDVCRHFGIDKVFIYDFGKFRATYGVSELENLISHLQQRAEWTITLPSHVLQREIVMSTIISSLDRFIYI